MMGQGQIHVVAAEQHVIADRDARQHQLPGFLADRDEGEIRSAAADVADQHDVADFDLLAPFVMARLDPGIERRLRLLQKGDALQPRRLRRLDGQLARHRVEGRRHRQDDVLLFEPMLDRRPWRSDSSTHRRNA